MNRMYDQRLTALGEKAKSSEETQVAPSLLVSPLHTPPRSVFVGPG